MVYILTNGSDLEFTKFKKAFMNLKIASSLAVTPAVTPPPRTTAPSLAQTPLKQI